MPKAKRAKQSLPDWAKNPENYQYKKGSGHKYLEVPKKKSGVYKPETWTPKDVLKNYGK